MHIGLMMDCDYREGGSQHEAFDEAFAMAEAGRIKVHTGNIPLEEAPAEIAALDRGYHGVGRMIAVPQ